MKDTCPFCMAEMDLHIRDLDGSFYPHFVCVGCDLEYFPELSWWEKLKCFIMGLLGAE